MDQKHKQSVPFPTIFPVTCHTDQVGPGSTFVVIKGFKTDGLLFVPRALERGATLIIVQEDVVIPAELQLLIDDKGAVVHRVADTRKALADLSARAAGYPAHKLHIIGITGTKGKTTTSFLLKHILSHAEYRTALLSTAGNYIDGGNCIDTGNYIDEMFPAPLTTAQPDYLHQFLSVCVARGVTHVVMEVAAQALTLNRVDGIVFESIIFTNFALEHLEFYDNLDSYFAAKCLLLDQRLPGAKAYVNGDDERCASLVNRYDDIVTYGVSVNAHMCITNMHAGTLAFDMHIKRDIGNQDNVNRKESINNQNTIDAHEALNAHSIFDRQSNVNDRVQTDMFLKETRESLKHTSMHFECPVLLGTFNVYNIAAAVSVALDMGLSVESINAALQSFAGVPGRFERHALSNGATGIIDYAHNPLSYQAILPELRALTDHLMVIFGAGGERDASRRPLMGLLVAHYADIMMVTSDNPRSEDPGVIVQDICADVPDELRYKIIIELDREQAIKKAFALSKKTTIIALLGKGPDCYQIIGSHKTVFNEAEILAAL